VRCQLPSRGTVRQGLAGIARHVIACVRTQDTKDHIRDREDEYERDGNAFVWRHQDSALLKSVAAGQGT
jgi:hypothetical protein